MLSPWKESKAQPREGRVTRATLFHLENGDEENQEIKTGDWAACTTTVGVRGGEILSFSRDQKEAWRDGSAGEGTCQQV